MPLCLARRPGYFREVFRAAMAAERTRRRAQRAAIEASLAARPGARLPVVVLRRHLGEFHGADHRAAPISELARACRGVARVRGKGRRAVLLGVCLRRPRARALSARWEARLLEEGLREEPTAIPRGILDLDPGGDAMVLPGQLYRAAEGVIRQAADVEAVEGYVDTRNRDGTRGRIRRHLSYFARLRTAASREEVELTRRQRLVVDVLLDGGTWRDVGQRIGVRSMSRAQEVIAELYQQLGIEGPGPGK